MEDRLMEQPIIELNQLTKRYGEQIAVNHLNLTIYKGEIFGLLGPNGAGKTTSILMMLGLAEPTSGHASVCGYDPARQAMQVKRRVGYMPDDVGFYEDRTALDNIIYTARLNGIPLDEAHEQANAILDRVGLSEAKYKKVGAFSRGMRQRLGLADVLIKQPEVVILDEPTLGIDPEGVRELLQLIHDLSRKEGLTVLLSSHHLHQVQQICDRVGLFVKGNLIASGDVQSLAHQLDEDGSITVELEVAADSGLLSEQLASLDGILDFHEAKNSEQKQDGSAVYILVGSKDLTMDAVSTVMNCGAELRSVRRRQYGLDDIYHRYFEGGAPSGGNEI